VKFQANLVLKFNASSIAEAGQKVNDLLEQARTVYGLEAESVMVGTSPAGEPVTVPLPSPAPTEDLPAPSPPPHPRPPYPTAVSQP
jgi:hypothetical protein